MLDLKFIEPSAFPYYSPMVKKSDQIWRFCIDIRAISDIIDFDCEPVPTTENALGNFTNEQYFSELDLTKGYWQIRLGKESKIYTGYATNEELMVIEGHMNRLLF